MARYIDADELIAYLEDEIKECALPFGDMETGRSIAYGTVLGLKSAFAFAKARAAADVLEVVRCEKCKHLTIYNSMDLYAFCEKTKYRFRPFQTDTRTHFCSYGERKV